MRKVDANWYEGRIGDRKGIVPSSYLDVFSEPDVKGMFVLEEATNYVKFFCFKKLGQVTIHFRLNKIRLQGVWWKSDTAMNNVVRLKFVKPHTIGFWINSQLALEFNRELLWFCFSSFYDWSKKITPLYQPIKFKTKPSRVLLDRVFPRCRQLTYFYFDFSLTPQPIKIQN